VKKPYLALLLCLISAFTFGQDQEQTKAQKKQARKDHINKLIKEEEEGALIYNKQSAFGFKFNTDGWGLMYEHGKYKTINTTNIWWLEFDEHKSHKEDKVPGISDGYYQYTNPYIVGKINNFYLLKFGIGQQRLIGGKGNKSGVAVSAIYGGGLTIGYLKPYYLNVIDSTSNGTIDVKYSTATDHYYRDPSSILGSAGFFKGLGEGKIVPGLHVKTALRFDYGRYNQFLSAIETGVALEYYTQDMRTLLDVPDQRFFFNAYIALEFGSRK
jgi:hypothetical protein